MSGTMARWTDSWIYGMMDGRTDRWMEGINCFYLYNAINVHLNVSKFHNNATLKPLNTFHATHDHTKLY